MKALHSILIVVILTATVAFVIYCGEVGMATQKSYQKEQQHGYQP